MSAKKTAVGPSSVRVKAAADDSAQSAVARRSAEGELRAMIIKLTPKNLRLITALRRLLRKYMPTAHEVVYEYRNLGAVVISFSPSEQGYEGVLALRADANSTKLYFNQGKELPDPEKLLQGSAQARWISIEVASNLSRPAVASLIKEAIAHNRVPFSSAGRGAVVIRSKSGKKSPPKKK